MKTLFTLLLLQATLLSFNHSAIAQETKNKVLLFSGKLSGDTNHKEKKVLSVQYTKDDGFSSPARGQQFLQYHELDSTGKFSFTLPDLGKPYKIGLAIKAGKTKRLWDQYYYADSGDSIHLNINLNGIEKSTRISGKGSAKYNLIESLAKVFDIEYMDALFPIALTGTNSQNIDSLTVKLKMNSLDELIRKFMSQKKEMIKRAGVPAAIGELIGFEFAPYQSERSFRTGLLLKAYPAYRDVIIRAYWENNDSFKMIPNISSLKCPYYLLNCLNIKVFQQRIQNQDKPGFASFYNQIKNSFEQPIRDRLLADLLLKEIFLTSFKEVKPHEMDSLLKDAAATIQTLNVKKAILQQIEDLKRIENGRQIFPGEFLTQEGNLVKLRALKGKVILIDVWFLGCSGCAEFHRKFEKNVYPKFSGNKNFVMLSININKKKEDWDKGMASGLYTSKDYLNVGTGNGIDHPFMKFYNVKGAPFMLLVDRDGNIDTLSQAEGTVEGMIAKLEKTLGK